jgi:hypothetical protein
LTRHSSFSAAVVGTAGADPSPEVRNVTVTSVVTSLVPVTTQVPTTSTIQATTTAPPTTRPRPTTTRSAPPTTRRRTATTRPARNCDPSYPDFCIPPPPPDLNCADVPASNFTVQGSDPHGFDADGDGVGCES